MSGVRVGFRGMLLLVLIGGCGGQATESMTAAPDDPVQDESGASAREGSANRDAQSSSDEDTATQDEQQTGDAESSMDLADEGTTGTEDGAQGEPAPGEDDAQTDTASVEGLDDSPEASHCKIIDGELAYGPIGDPIPLPAWAFPVDECATCKGAVDVFGFRTPSGYDFVWTASVEGTEPTPNLYGLSLDANFEGGEPRALLAAASVHVRELVATPQGYLATTCSSQPQASWLQLSPELSVIDSPLLTVPEAAVDTCTPSVVWTGQTYVSAAADSRGLSVIVLDEEGTDLVQRVLGEASITGPIRLSANGGRVLVAYYDTAEHELLYVVLDGEGTLVADAQRVNEQAAEPLDFTIVTSGKGWTINTGYAKYDFGGIQVTQVSPDGANLRQIQATPGGLVSNIASTPSAYGGTLVTGARDTGGQGGESYWLTALIDANGEAAYLEDLKLDEAEYLRRGLIRDPDRDLVIEWPLDGEALFVQEYGCLE